MCGLRVSAACKHELRCSHFLHLREPESLICHHQPSSPSPISPPIHFPAPCSHLRLINCRQINAIKLQMKDTNDSIPLLSWFRCCCLFSAPSLCLCFPDSDLISSPMSDPCSDLHPSLAQVSTSPSSLLIHSCIRWSRKSISAWRQPCDPTHPMSRSTF